MENKKVISITLSKKLISLVKKKAAEEGRSFSSMVEMILKGKSRLL